KAGGAFAALDSNYPEKRLQLMLEETAARYFLVEGKHAAKIRDMVAQEDAHFFLVDDSSENDSELALHLKTFVPTYDLLATPVLLEPDDMCYIYFTSGSTGKPKAIAGRLGGLSHFIAWERKTFQVNETFRVSQIIPPSFDPFLRDIFVP